MLHHTTDTTLADSQRACLRLVERLAEKYGGVAGKHPKTVSEFAARRVNIDALRAQGFQISVAPPAPEMLRIERPPAQRNRLPAEMMPRLLAAVNEAEELKATFGGGRAPMGSLVAISKKHGVPYQAMFNRIRFGKRANRNCRHGDSARSVVGREISKAADEVWQTTHLHGGALPRGALKAIAERHGVKYRSLISRVNATMDNLGSRDCRKSA